MTWLVGTLVWTGALIALVLFARRPVSRHFGPKAAYALWFIPLARLMLPPIVLPAWLAPAESEAVPATVVAYAPASPGAASAVAAMPAEPSFNWEPLLLALWCAGALTYITLRLLSYFQLRRQLLADARPVGTEGRVRLLETPATASPLAFGVIDKVVALPPGFMAAPDRRARDLALAHELAHHRAHDLAFNFFALPLFAMHWFNPLSLLGWRAMRRDQEAACDARVVDRRDRSDRAAYAVLIASAVAGPRGALAAPMACPVLGDKSIVHRLRSLTMTTPSDRRRRAGALLLGAGMLLVPLTASISYAQDGDVPVTPEPPLPPLAPAPPVAPATPGTPLAPEAPLPPAAGNGSYVIDHTSPDGTRRERTVVIVRKDKDGAHVAGAPHVIRERHVIHAGPDGQFDEEAFEKEMEALEKRLEHMGEDIERSVDVDHRAIALAARDSARAGRTAALAAARVPRVVMNCDGENNVTESTTADGKRVIAICRQHIARSAAAGLRTARERIAQNADMPESTRKEVLQSLDREIERAEKGE